VTILYRFVSIRMTMHEYGVRYLKLIMCKLSGSTLLARCLRTGRSRRSSSAGIPSGKYPPNIRIPTESELVETYEVARSTARRAIAALREEGLVYTVPARGTYVAERGNSTKQALDA
jgi:hypothetical protein